MEPFPAVPAVAGFLDADCFYVTAERKREPGLRGRPVGVLGNQDACVIAASYELKKYGVKVGTPRWEAERLCPGVELIVRDFEWYGEVSGQVHDLMRYLSPKVEYYSVDEFFFESTDLPRTLGLPTNHYGAAAQRLRETIWRELEVAVSVGLAPSRTLAKLACKQGKPDGAEAWLNEERTRARLEHIPVEEVAGIASGRQRRLKRCGISTCGQYRRADRVVIRDLLTVDGEAMWWELNGEPVIPIRATRPPRKMLLRGGSVRRATDDAERLWAWTVRHCERLVGAMQRECRHCRTVSLSLDFRPLSGPPKSRRSRDGVWNGSAALGCETRSLRQILAVIKPLFEAGLRDGEIWAQREAGEDIARGEATAQRVSRALVSRVHVGALDLVPDEARQLSLFEQADSDHIDVLRESINSRVGRFRLRSGSTLPLKDLYDRRVDDYDISDIAGKSCF